MAPTHYCHVDSDALMVGDAFGGGQARSSGAHRSCRVMTSLYRDQQRKHYEYHSSQGRSTLADLRVRCRSTFSPILPRVFQSTSARHQRESFRCSYTVNVPKHAQPIKNTPPGRHLRSTAIVASAWRARRANEHGMPRVKNGRYIEHIDRPSRGRP